MVHLALVADDLLQQSKRLVQINSGSGGDVEYVSGGLRVRCLDGQKVRRNNIVNVSEIAALLAIPKYRRLLIREHLGNEFCQHAGIGRGRVLARTKDVEVSQADGF